MARMPSHWMAMGTPLLSQASYPYGHPESYRLELAGSNKARNFLSLTVTRTNLSPFST